MSINNVVRVCVDRRINGDVFGRFYTVYDLKPTPFAGTAALLLKMERFYDRLGFPMSTTRPRSFNGQITGKEDMAVVEEKNLLVPSGEKASFLVRVVFRQNSSMQGTLRWVEGKKEANFRSALELMRLLDSASSISSVWFDTGNNEETHLESDVDAVAHKMIRMINA